MPPASDYSDQTIALLTRHGKEQVIGPVLEAGLCCVIEHVSGFDTDQFGTFTRDIARPGTQLDAARRKARKAIELSGRALGLASEGSFGPDRVTGLVPWNIELLLLIDDRLGIEVIGLAEDFACSGQLRTGEWTDVHAYAQRNGFPQHRLILRPQDQDDPRIHKDIADWDRLKACFEACQVQADNRLVSVENDLRAFANPTRMRTIERAARDLLARVQSCCPVCETPGYWITQRQPGRPCSWCRMPTAMAKNEVWSCLRCEHVEVKAISDPVSADPGQCAHCNP